VSKISTKYYLILILFFLSLYSNAQKWNLKYHYYSHNTPKELKKIFSQTSFKDSIQIINYLKTKRITAIKNAYLDLSIDSINFLNSKTAIAYLSLNKKYQYLKISFDEKDEYILRKTNSLYLKKHNKNIYNFSKENKTIANWLANNAYPFAKVYWDSLSFLGDSIKAHLKIDKGEYIVFDTLIINGNLKLNSRLIARYTSWISGQKFKKDILQSFQKKINDLVFAKMEKAPKMLIKNGKAILYVEINKKNSNRLDGILGILPNDKTSTSVMLTGELNIALQNIAKQAEDFNFNWKKQEVFSQELQINTTIPYLFYTLWGISS